MLKVFQTPELVVDRHSPELFGNFHCRDGDSPLVEDSLSPHFFRFSIEGCDDSVSMRTPAVQLRSWIASQKRLHIFRG